jgi:hypothetical protein
MTAEFAIVRSEMGVLRADMARDMAGLRTEMADQRTELHQSIVNQTRWLVGYISAFGAIMLAVARLLF